MRKTLCFALALALTTGMLVFSGSNTEVKTHAATIEELQQKLEEYAQKQEELDNQINATRNDAAKEKQNQQAINSNIATTEEKIRTLKDIITEYGDNISDIVSHCTVHLVFCEQAKWDSLLFPIHFFYIRFLNQSFACFKSFHAVLYRNRNLSIRPRHKEVRCHHHRIAAAVGGVLDSVCLCNLLRFLQFKWKLFPYIQIAVIPAK